MAFDKFNSIQYIKTIDTGESPELGGFSTTLDTELVNARLLIYFNGVAGGTETLRIDIYNSSSLDGLLYQSNTISLSSIANFGTNWLGWVRFDFANFNIGAQYSYYPVLVTGNYTRNGDSSYLGYLMDIEQTNTLGTANKPAAAIEYYGLR